MPELCRLGKKLVIYMVYDDHPMPHFHASYVGEEISVEIHSLRVTESTRSRFPLTQKKKVLKWAGLRQAELVAAWDRAQNHQDPGRIAPL